MNSPRIAIFNDSHGWHSAQLIRALTHLGIEAVLTDLADCQIDIDQPSGLLIPGFESSLPAAVLVRGIAPGSLEQITLRMDVLHTLSELGVPVINSASAIEHTVDKARTSLRLHLAGIATPQTWACESPAHAEKIAKTQFEQGAELIIKPLFGCQGKGLEKVTDLQQFKQMLPVGGAFYLQRYIAPKTPGQWQDWRLMVIDNQICAAMSRRSEHWITNFAQGARCFATTVSEQMAQLAIRATQAVNADYAGVDLIQHRDGHFLVLEVNSVPAWKGLYQTTGIDVAAHLAETITAAISRATCSGHAV